MLTLKKSYCAKYVFQNKADKIAKVRIKVV